MRCIYGPATYGTYEIAASNPTAGAITSYLDGNSCCVFQRITTNGPGGVLEEFNKPNVYIPCVFDLNVSPYSRINYWSAFGNYPSSQPDYTASAIVSDATSLPDDTAANIRIEV